MSDYKVEHVLKEFNIKLDRLWFFLKKNGIDVEKSPNGKLDQLSYSLIEKEFASQRQIKDNDREHKLKRTSNVLRIANALNIGVNREKDKGIQNTSSGFRTHQKLRSYAIKVIDAGGFYFNVSTNGVLEKKYKCFEETEDDLKLKKQMRRGRFNSNPLTMSFEGNIIRNLIWDETSECLRVYSESEIKSLKKKTRTKKARTKKNANKSGIGVGNNLICEDLDKYKKWALRISGLGTHRCGKSFNCSCCGVGFGVRQGWRVDNTDYCFCKDCMERIREKMGPKQTTAKGKGPIISTPMRN